MPSLAPVLLQDIAVVPFLVLLPLAVQLQSGGGIDVADVAPASLISMLGGCRLTRFCHTLLYRSASCSV